MRIFLFILLALISVASTASYAQDEGFTQEMPAWDNSTQTEEKSILAFVGRKTFVEKQARIITRDHYSYYTGTITRSADAMDTPYAARYEILDLLSGAYETPSIDFIAHDLYSAPSFATENPVLVFLQSHKGAWSRKKQFYPVYQTKGGEWAICGSALENDASEAQRKLAVSYVEQLEFLKPLKMHNGKQCTSGTQARNIVAYQDQTRFAPERRRVACNREIGIHPVWQAGTGLSHDANVLEAAKHAACIEKLEVEQGL